MKSINSKRIILWIMILTLFSFMQIFILDYLLSDPITNILAKNNPDVDGPQLFPAFMIVMMVSWSVIIPIMNYIALCLSGFPTPRLNLNRKERIITQYAFHIGGLLLFFIIALYIMPIFSGSSRSIQDLLYSFVYMLPQLGIIFVYVSIIIGIVEGIQIGITRFRKKKINT